MSAMAYCLKRKPFLTPSPHVFVFTNVWSDMEEKVKILGFVGSLSKGSYNKALMRAAVTLVPENAEIEIFDIAQIPPFNQDLESSPPQSVKDFRAKIKEDD
jgi:chromate reductase, NAD(P)H dehydrogenase (quinone)